MSHYLAEKEIARLTRENAQLQAVVEAAEGIAEWLPELLEGMLSPEDGRVVIAEELREVVSALRAPSETVE